jgi:hypothetical protein
VLVKSPPARTLGDSTVNKYLHNLSHLFELAKDKASTKVRIRFTAS